MVSIGNFTESSATKLQSILCKHYAQCTEASLTTAWESERVANFESKLQFHSSEQIKMVKYGATMTTFQFIRKYPK